MNLAAGDTVYLEYAGQNQASFKENSLKVLKSIVGLAGGIAKTGAIVYTDGAAEKFSESFDQAVAVIQSAIPDSVKGDRRDAFGQDEHGNYASEEGGIIVCMPKSGGPVYSNNKTHLPGDVHGRGRLPEYFSQFLERNEAWFPCREPNGLMSFTSSDGGVMSILPFDKMGSFGDNAGSYEIAVSIVRGAENHDALRAQMRQSGLLK